MVTPMHVKIEEKTKRAGNDDVVCVNTPMKYFSVKLLFVFSLSFCILLLPYYYYILFFDARFSLFLSSLYFTHCSFSSFFNLTDAKYGIGRPGNDRHRNNITFPCAVRTDTMKTASFISETPLPQVHFVQKTLRNNNTMFVVLFDKSQQGL